MNYAITHPEITATFMSYFDLKEVPGEGNNPEIINFFKEIGHGWVQTDETAWCSAMLNYAAKINSYEYSGELHARSWMDVGRSVKNPNPGDIVVFWRIHKTKAWQGHVGLYVRQKGSYIYCLGGNQNNRVCISAYPKASDNYGLLGFRQLRTVYNIK